MLGLGAGGGFLRALGGGRVLHQQKKVYQYMYTYVYICSTHTHTGVHYVYTCRKGAKCIHVIRLVPTGETYMYTYNGDFITTDTCRFMHLHYALDIYTCISSLHSCCIFAGLVKVLYTQPSRGKYMILKAEGPGAIAFPSGSEDATTGPEAF